jgi:hypothetical protein
VARAPRSRAAGDPAVACARHSYLLNRSLFDLQTVANDYLTMSSGAQGDYYIKFRGKTYDNAEAVKKLRDTIEPEDF